VTEDELIPHSRHQALLKAEKDQIFEKEFYPLMNALYNFAYHLVYNETDAQDLVQETYLKAYRFLESYDRGTNAKAWLFTILKNSFINDYRKKVKRPMKVDYEDIARYHDTDDASYVGSLDMRQEVYRGIFGDEMTNALLSISPDFRLIVLLCDVNGFSYEEMSKILDIPIGTVRSRLFRARNALKSKLIDYAVKRGYKIKR